MNEPVADDVKILLVDDMSLFSLHVLSGLKKNGFNAVEMAVNGRCMLDYLKRGNFGLVISNWFRLETSGVELVKTIKGHPDYRDLPIIMLIDPEETDRSRPPEQEGVARFVSIPVDFRRLTQTILEVLGKKVPASEY